MAQTFTAYFSGITFAATKNMGAILNTSATEVLKIYRIGLVNAQTAAVTGVITELNVRIIQTSATLTSSTTITPVSHDTNNTAPASATYGSAGTIGGTPATIRRTIWSNDEPAVSALTSDEMECFIPFNIIWDAGYGDSNVQPLTLRQNQMAYVFNVTSTSVGTLDVWMEFTKE
jgi:hypothetical protein